MKPPTSMLRPARCPPAVFRPTGTGSIDVGRLRGLCRDTTTVPPFDLHPADRSKEAPHAVSSLARPLALVVAGVQVPLDTRTDGQLNDKSD